MDKTMDNKTMDNKTMVFSLGEGKDAEMKKILSDVYNALVQKGYKAISQIAAYMLSEDPTYITTHNNARKLIRKIDRNELLKAMIRSYLSNE